MLERVIDETEAEHDEHPSLEDRQEAADHAKQEQQHPGNVAQNADEATRYRRGERP